MEKTRKELNKNLLFTIITLVLFFLLAEVTLRTYQWFYRGVPFFSFFSRYQQSRFPLSPFLVFGPRVNWQLPGKEHPETAYFNKQGFRTQETVGNKKPGEYRIIALGGSTTEDVWNEKGIHWPLILERKLHKDGYPHVTVFNSAMSAYSTAHSLIRLAFDIPEFKPDMVLMMHNINDLTVNYYAAIAGTTVDPHYLVKYGKKRYTGNVEESDIVLSRVFHAIIIRLKGLGSGKLSKVPQDISLERGIGVFRRNLRTISAIARSNNIRLVLLTEPVCRSRKLFEETKLLAARGFTDSLGSYEEFLSGMTLYNNAILEVGAEEGIHIIDMASELGGDESNFVDIVHYSNKGVEAFGEKIGIHVERLLGVSMLSRGNL